MTSRQHLFQEAKGEMSSPFSLLAAPASPQIFIDETVINLWEKYAGLRPYEVV